MRKGVIIEDVQSWEWIDILKNEVPENLHFCTFTPFYISNTEYKYYLYIIYL